MRGHRETLADRLADAAGAVTRHAGAVRAAASSHVVATLDPDRDDVQAEVHRLALRMEALSDDIAAHEARLRT